MNTSITTRIMATLIAALCVLSSMQVSQADEKVYETTIRSTAWIIAGNSMGTGVLVDRDEKLVVTNFHVIEGNENAVVFFPVFRDGRAVSDHGFYETNSDKHAIAATVVASDSHRDIAILKLERIPSDIRAIEFGTQTRPGQNVHSIGNPGASDAMWIYTYGKVRQNYYRKSSLDFGPTQMQVLETDSPINQGDSGGPIVDDEGRLVGISQSMSLTTRLYSYGVDITEITWYLNRYKRTLADGNTQPTMVESICHSVPGANNVESNGTTTISDFFAKAEGHK